MPSDIDISKLSFDGRSRADADVSSDQTQRFRQKYAVIAEKGQGDATKAQN